MGGVKLQGKVEIARKPRKTPFLSTEMDFDRNIVLNSLKCTILFFSLNNHNLCLNKRASAFAV